MRRWLFLVALAIFLSGCKSMTHPDKVKPDKDIRSNVPTGEGPPFGTPPS